MPLPSPTLSRLDILRKKLNCYYLDDDIDIKYVPLSKQENSAKKKQIIKEYQQCRDGQNNHEQRQVNNPRSNNKYSIILSSKKKKKTKKKCPSLYIGGSIHDNCNETDYLSLSSSLPCKKSNQNNICSQLKCTRCNSKVIRYSGKTKQINTILYF